MTATSIGTWTLHEVLGRGGMGVVHRATSADGRVAALKLLDVTFVSKELLVRFEREARVLERLDHPGIVRFLDAGVAAINHASQPWLAMELVEGASLAEAVRDAGRDWRPRVAWLADIADAVTHAHARGVVHRDLKPANVIVRPDGRPCVLDFGVARLVTGQEPAETLATRTGLLVGTVSWMSPEQVIGVPGAAGPPADVHALGLLAHFVLTGEGAWGITPDSLADAIVTIANTPPRPLCSLRPDLPRGLDELVAAALAKNPERRPTAATLASDLRRVIAGERTSFARTRTRRRALTAAAVLAPALALGFVLGAPWVANQALRNDAILASRTLDLHELAARSTPGDTNADGRWFRRLSDLDAEIAQLPATPIRRAARALLLHDRSLRRPTPRASADLWPWFVTRVSDAWAARDALPLAADTLRRQDPRWRTAFGAFTRSRAGETLALASLSHRGVDAPHGSAGAAMEAATHALRDWARERGTPEISDDSLWAAGSRDSLERPDLWRVHARATFLMATEDSTLHLEAAERELRRLSEHPAMRTRPLDAAGLALERASVSRLLAGGAPPRDAWSGRLAELRAAAIAEGRTAFAREVAIEQAHRAAAGGSGGPGRQAALARAIAVLDSAGRWPAEGPLDPSCLRVEVERAALENDLARLSRDSLWAFRALRRTMAVQARLAPEWIGLDAPCDLERGRALAFLYRSGADPRLRLQAEAALGRPLGRGSMARWPAFAKRRLDAVLEFERFRVERGDPEL